jgi:hypothetical protein
MNTSESRDPDPARRREVKRTLDELIRRVTRGPQSNGMRCSGSEGFEGGWRRVRSMRAVEGSGEDSSAGRGRVDA